MGKENLNLLFLPVFFNFALYSSTKFPTLPVFTVGIMGVLHYFDCLFSNSLPCNRL